MLFAVVQGGWLSLCEFPWLATLVSFACVRPPLQVACGMSGPHVARTLVLSYSDQNYTEHLMGTTTINVHAFQPESLFFSLLLVRLLPVFSFLGASTRLDSGTATD